MSVKESLIDEVKAFLKTDANETFASEKDNGFCWELYLNFHLYCKCQNLLVKKLIPFSKEGKTDQEFLKSYQEVVESLEDIVLKFKDDFLKEYDLVSVSFEEMLPKIISFFKEKRSVDFLALNDEAQKDLLRHEDIVAYEDSLHNYIRMTHMQYKYLYQKGSVFL